MIKTILSLIGCVALFCLTAKHFHTDEDGSLDAYGHAFCGKTYVLAVKHSAPKLAGYHDWSVMFQVVDADILPNWDPQK
jgi:hypothetical protein